MGNRKKKRIRISKDGLVGIVSDMVKAELAEKARKGRFEIADEAPDLDRFFTENYIRRDLSQAQTINEGLISTYDAETVKGIICRKFCLPERQVSVQKVTDGDVSTDIIVIAVDWSWSSDEIGEIKRTMRTCGYFESQPKTSVGMYIVMVFEPKFANEVTDTVFEKCDFLYHAAPSVFVGRILEKGLEPKTKNTAFKYPPRVYMVRNLSGQSIGLLKKIQDERGGKVLFDDNEYTILSIEIGKLPSHVRFFMDPTAPNSVFTYDNIPPHAIKAVTELQ